MVTNINLARSLIHNQQTEMDICSLGYLAHINQKYMLTNALAFLASIHRLSYAINIIEVAKLYYI